LAPKGYRNNSAIVLEAYGSIGRFACFSNTVTDNTERHIWESIFERPLESICPLLSFRLCSLARIGAALGDSWHYGSSTTQ
jgi:hypothetical protein